ncbi:MAG: potassium-transporting ATPase subunit C [Chthoniobacter sp.]|nr:potassium-transporting ATPase subunit C [Chthoniobacter sp.]
MRAKLAIVVASVSLIVFIVCLGKVIRESQRDRLLIPDEKAVAAAMLEKKLSGPGYFSATSDTDDPREPKITVDDAKAQVARVVSERHLDAEHAAKLNELIDRLSEPATSRIVGEATVNLLRLNLALDAQR